MRRVLSSILMVLAIVLAFAFVVVLVASLATTDGSSRIAREGQAAVISQSAITQASTLRNGAINVTLRAEIDRANAGVDGVIDPTPYRDDVRLLLASYEVRIADLVGEIGPDEGAAVAVASAEFVADVEDVILALGSAEASEVTQSSLASGSYDALIGSLIEVRDARVREALGRAEYAGEAADGIRFVVVIILPLIAVFIMRWAFRRRREREVLEAEIEQQRAVIESKDEFVTNLSHELRTPLTGVYGFALALDEGALDDPETAKELTSLIVSDAAELSRMVDDLITAGQLETDSVALNPEEMPLDPEIETVLEPFVRAGAAIEFTPTDASAVVDRQRFRQVLRNLVSNAVKHGGESVEVFAEHVGGGVSVFVMDDGDGIDDDRMTKMFERYQHEGDEPLLQGSVGLGLATAYQLAIAMGGDLTYTRTNGMTYFVLKVPAHRTGRLADRVDDSLGAENAAQSASEVAKLFAR